MLLFFDCETSDLLKRNLPLEHDQQPWPLQIAAELTDDELQPLKPPQFMSAVIRADGRSIKQGAEAAHGVSSRQASKAGGPEEIAIAQLCSLAAQADMAVGHGVAFDKQIIMSSLMRIEARTQSALAWLATVRSTQMGERLGQVLRRFLSDVDSHKSVWTRPGLQFFCTMLAATPLCKIVPDPPRDDGSYRWPTLDRACEIFLGEEPRSGAHDAWQDCQKAKRLFGALRERGVVEMPV